MANYWNLNTLYTAFDAPELVTDLARLKTELEALVHFSTDELTTYAHADETLLTYFSLTDAFFSLRDRINNYANLIYAVDTTNTKAIALIEQVENYNPQITSFEVNFKKWLNGLSDLEKRLLENEALKKYAFSIQFQKANAAYLLSDAEETLLAQMQNTGSGAWSKLQDASIASLMVPYGDETLPITVIRSYAFSPDPEKRKKAYEAELAAYSKIENISAACINAIKGEAMTIASKRGYASPLEMTLLNARMDFKTLEAMMGAIKSSLPIFRKYLKKKAELLHHKNSLPFYDLFAPIGAEDMVYTYDEAKAFIVLNFSTFSEKLGAYAQRAFDGEWIDSKPRAGKVAGAFCANIHGIGESRIMINFSGSYNDVSTLAHELGHGYHGECLKNEPFANSDYPMPIAETASIFCETIVSNAALKTATPAQRLAILENDLMSATQVIVDIYSRYLFETALFEKRKEGSLSLDALKELMLDAQKEAYGDGLDPNCLHPNMWTCKPHYYSVDSNFYNFPYAFGLMFSKGLYAMYLEEGAAFIPKYDALLTATGSHDVYDTLAIVGVDAHSSAFFRKSLELIQEEIEVFLKL